VAIVFSLPAQCVSCVTSNNDCAHCAAIAVTNQIASSQSTTCCQSHQRAIRTAETKQLSVQLERHSSDCTCQNVPTAPFVPRTSPTTTSSEVLTALPHVAFLAPSYLQSATVVAESWLVHLSPSIPHRILHCSWLI
jgi:hypothetical protein